MADDKPRVPTQEVGVEQLTDTDPKRPPQSQPPPRRPKPKGQPTLHGAASVPSPSQGGLPRSPMSVRSEGTSIGGSASSAEEGEIPLFECCFRATGLTALVGIRRFGPPPPPPMLASAPPPPPTHAGFGASAAPHPRRVRRLHRPHPCWLRRLHRPTHAGFAPPPPPCGRPPLQVRRPLPPPRCKPVLRRRLPAALAGRRLRRAAAASAQCDTRRPGPHRCAAPGRLLRLHNAPSNLARTKKDRVGRSRPHRGASTRRDSTQGPSSFAPRLRSSRASAGRGGATPRGTSRPRSHR